MAPGSQWLSDHHVFLGMSVSLLLCMMEGRVSDFGLINVFLQLIMRYGVSLAVIYALTLLAVSSG